MKKASQKYKGAGDLPLLYDPQELLISVPPGTDDPEIPLGEISVENALDAEEWDYSRSAEVWTQEEDRRKMADLPFRFKEQACHLLEAGQKGDWLAIEALHAMAKYAAIELAKFKPDAQVFQMIAKHESRWPILANGKQSDSSIEYVKKVPLDRISSEGGTGYQDDGEVLRLLITFETRLLMQALHRHPPPEPWMVHDVQELGIDTSLRIDRENLKAAFSNGLSAHPGRAKEDLNGWFDIVRSLILQQTGGGPTASSRQRLRAIGERAKVRHAQAGESLTEGRIKAYFFNLLKSHFKTWWSSQEPRTKLKSTVVGAA